MNFENIRINDAYAKIYGKKEAVNEADALKRSPANVAQYSADSEGGTETKKTLDGRINLRGKAGKLRDREVSAASRLDSIVKCYEDNKDALLKISEDADKNGLWRISYAADELLEELSDEASEAEVKLSSLRRDVKRTYSVGKKYVGDTPNTVQHESAETNEAAEVTWVDGTTSSVGGIYSPHMFNEWMRSLERSEPEGDAPIVKSVVINGKTYTAEELRSDVYNVAEADAPQKIRCEREYDKQLGPIWYIYDAESGKPLDAYHTAEELKKDVTDGKYVLVNKIAEADEGGSQGDNTPIFTLDVFDITKDEGVESMEWAKTYTDFDEACDDAMKCAKSYMDSDSVINVSVMAGEYQKPNGDIYGEPEAVYTVSNKNEEETAIAREKANFVAKYVDGYATDRAPKSEEGDSAEKLD